MTNYANINNEELVLLYQRQEPNSLEQNFILVEILKRVDGVMRQVARQFANIPNTDETDRVGEMHITLLKVLEDFDITLGNKLTTVCRTYFRHSMTKMYNKQTKAKRWDGQAFQVSIDDINERRQREGQDEIAFSVECAEYTDIDLDITLSRLGLTEKERITCSLLIEGHKQSQIADALKVSPTMIKKYMNNVRWKMQLAGITA